MTARQVLALAFGILMVGATPVDSFDLQGHRGARGLLPENTLAAFAKALDAAESLSRQAEEAAVRVFDMSPEELAARRNLLVRRYAEKGLLPDPVDLYIERFGNVVDTDLARELIPAFGRGTRDERALLADELHETASSLSERVWNRLLEAQPVAGTVAIKAGGSGAGKTTALVDASEFDAVLDTTLSSFESATRKIDRALATGRSVEINYVHRDPAVAYTDGVLSPERLAGDGRVGPLDEHVRMHVGANETIRKLRDHYAGKPVTFRAIDNSRPGAPLTDIDALPTLKYDAIEKEVRRAYDAQAGRLTAAQREAALRSAHRETPRRPSGSGARGSRGPDGRADAARSDRGGAARGSAEDDLAFFDARGFFPHRSEYELVGGGHGAAVGRPATGAVIGKPQPGRAFERRRNELRLYSEGSVQTSPRVLSNTLRQRERFLRTEEARRWLYENGTPPGDEIPRGSMLVRNPDGPRATIPPELRAAVENPDDVARLASREGGQVEPRAFERWVDEWLWRGEGDRPEWAFDVDNVRIGFEICEDAWVADRPARHDRGQQRHAARAHPRRLPVADRRRVPPPLPQRRRSLTRGTPLGPGARNALVRSPTRAQARGRRRRPGEPVPLLGPRPRPRLRRRRPPRPLHPHERLALGRRARHAPHP